ncbi:ATP-binding protein [Brevibacillus massiliensis]|uniref:ATP-binding protein n=1 Tax=Brevibacillus massiliensis TaxID=1118054 RepID=UPI0002FAD93B|nr:sensor histidine kinase [Brevibacillus massiliensis]
MKFSKGESVLFKLRNLPIKWKITIFSFGIVLFSALIGGIIILGTMFRMMEEEIGQRLLVTARTVAEIPVVRESMAEPDSWREIDPITNRIRIINNVDYIVVIDMNRIRLSDPVKQRIGTPFHGKEAEEAFSEHTYVNKVKGDQGTAIRAYVPVMDAGHRQVGLVIAGHLLPGIVEMIRSQQRSIAITLFLSLLFGIWGSWQLAKQIKRQMLDLEPHEIARILRERTAMFHAMHEGIIAIDNQERITVINDTAKRVFQITGDVIGQNIHQVIPGTRLPEILALQHGVYNMELRIGDTLIWSNRIPIRVGDKTVGAIAIFQDRTEVTRIAEELTGVKEFVEALRVQNHEYMNKLHTIAGLLQLGQTEKALDYLFKISEQQRDVSTFLTRRIADDNLSGLLLAKIRRGKELGVDVVVDRRSHLERFPEHLDHHDFVLVLGNLIENAFDALAHVERDKKEVYVSIEQDDELLSLMVEDNGCGMSPETAERIMERGYSTKQGENRGIGLFLVNQVVEVGKGKLVCDSEPGVGTSFILTFPMKGDGQ